MCGKCHTDGYYWLVGWGQGNPFTQTQFKVLWVDTRSNQPATRDCTIITNGNNLLKVYLDGDLVYSANNLRLNVPPPFNAYLEAQTSSSSQMLYGSYRDYYAAQSDLVTVTNAPTGTIAKIIDSSSGNVLASAKVSEKGTASLDVGKYHMPINNVYIRLYDSSGNNLLASTPSTIVLWGGDVYSVGSG